jgi:hypothetical protein
LVPSRQGPPDAARFVAEGVSTRSYPAQARVLLHAPAHVVAELVPPPPELRIRCAELSKRLAEAAARSGAV